MTTKLTRIVPSHRKTVEFNWCKNDFMEMSQRYRQVRAKFRHKMDACFWCGHAFSDGEMMALAQPKGRLNVVLCQDCAGKMEAA